MLLRAATLAVATTITAETADRTAAAMTITAETAVITAAAIIITVAITIIAVLAAERIRLRLPEITRPLLHRRPRPHLRSPLPTASTDS